MRAFLEEVLTGRRHGFAAACVRGALTPLEIAYRARLGYVRWSYLSGRRARARLSCRVISVGNLVAGGTGKTPMVQYLARRLREHGVSVAVILRGYGGRKSEVGGVVSDGERVWMSVEESGDEAQLHARTLPGVPVLIGRDRVAAGERAAREFGAEVIVLDDGFQTWQLQRDLDVLLIDATNPFGNGHLLPCGVLREPVKAMARADVVVLTKTEGVDGETLTQLETRLRTWLRADALIARARHKPTCFINWDGEQQPLSHLHGTKVCALSALADNTHFLTTLQRLGLSVEVASSFLDHHRYTQRDWQAARASGLPVVTTEKDWVKLDPTWRTPGTYALRIETEMTHGEREFLRAVIGE
ncbi:MAG: tetraacyldisaccharide 4'-kinase [Abditibacteriales bacterium]|nr:tetraacyldisaccharide 4'-kinase [Abditibacteriales bacterium]MDW8365668.1 tetraacyldisaccharide 4'-kinase [Abditibacteriales bacterium]